MLHTSVGVGLGIEMRDARASFAQHLRALG